MEEALKNINIKKVGNISMVVAFALITYYGLSAYKTYLEIQQLRNKQ